MDPREIKLSNLLVNYSCRVQPGEKVLIDYEGSECRNLVKQLIRDVYAAGGYPYVNIRDSAVNRDLMMGCTEESLKFQRDYQLHQMKGMDAYIAIRGTENAFELADVPSEKHAVWDRAYEDVLNYRVDKTKWVILRYPNAAMAQLAGTSVDSFADFFYDVCTLDYGKMSSAMDSLVELMNRTDKVRITGPGTDLTFSIKGIGAVKCAGECNIPDGEVYTAPVRESMNGVISYNTPSEEQGFTYENIVFEIENGKGIIVTNLQVKAEDVRKLIYTPDIFAIDLDVNGVKKNAVLKDIQFHPVTDNILHIDLLEVSDKKPVVMEVPVKLEGHAEGVKAGGKLTLSMKKIKVKALYTSIPERVVINVDHLGLGKTLQIGDLHFEGLELMNAKNAVVCAVQLTRAARGAQAAAEAAK